jgi:hypothetical protein
MCGVSKVGFASIFLVSALIFSSSGISRVRFASIFLNSGISKVCFTLILKICQDRRFVSHRFDIVEIAILYPVSLSVSQTYGINYIQNF